MTRVLVLGGTGEARDLAAALVAEGVEVTTSLAGSAPGSPPPPGDLRVGGFGGPEALGAWAEAHGVAAVVDATHPFAERISAAAAAACARRDLPLIRLERPGWAERAGDRWLRVADLHAAARAVPGLGRRALLSTGRTGLAAFARDQATWFLIRSISPPEPPLPPRHELLLDRGPYDVEGELRLLDRHRIEVVVTKDSGGDATGAKLGAARERGLPVVMVDRPRPPGAPTAATVADAVRLLHRAGVA